MKTESEKIRKYFITKGYTQLFPDISTVYHKIIENFEGFCDMEIVLQIHENSFSLNNKVYWYGCDEVKRLFETINKG